MHVQDSASVAQRRLRDGGTHGDAPGRSQPTAGAWSDELENLVHRSGGEVRRAVKYGDGKPVDVHVSRVGAMAKLDVTDHGMGIAPEEQQRIFARFHRGASAHGKGPGAGLGLWITRRQVEELGGVIHVASARETGSTFTVELPLAGPTPA